MTDPDVTPEAADAAAEADDAADAADLASADDAAEDAAAAPDVAAAEAAAAAPDVAAAEAAAAAPDVAAAEHAADAAPSEAPGVAATASVTRPARKRRDRALGTAGQVAGVVGIVVSLLLIVGVIVGRGWAVGTVDDVTAAVDTQIGKVEPLLLQASVRVGEISGRVGTVTDLAAGIAADPSPGGAVADALRAGVASVAERYQALRSNYTGVRESVVSMVDRLQTLDRIVPAFSVPQGPIDALAALDERLQSFDERVTGLITIDPGQGPINQAAAAIAQTAGDIETRLQGLQAGIGDVQQRISNLDARIADTASTIKTVITLGSGLIILLLAWVGFLHWVLFKHSGEIRRGPPAA